MWSLECAVRGAGKGISMKKIVIIGANDFQNPLILKAKELGYETHVFAWKDGAVGETTADYFYPISITEKEEILKECQRIKPDAVASIGSDLAVPTVVYLQQRLGQQGNSTESVQITTNKYEMRKALKSAGIPVPLFLKTSGEDFDLTDRVKREGLNLPVIVKPTDRSGSRGIMKITEWSQLKKAVKAAQEDSFEKAAIIEEYLEGNEYSCESISWKGTHHCLAITKKYTTGYPHFIETAHLEPSELSKELEEQIFQDIKKALDALKICYGASHAEFKVDAQGRIRIIEIGARMGGDCIGSHLVELSTGYDYLKMVLDVALGNEIDLLPKSEPGVSYVRFLFGKKDLDELNRLKREYPDNIHYISRLQVEEGTKITDSSNRYGYYIVRFDNIGKARSVLGL